ncbi:MAG: hypothetical protein QXT26_07910 [Thermoproteota archaeon]
MGSGVDFEEKIRKTEIKRTVRVYYTDKTICGFCNMPFELVELNSKGMKRWGHRYVLIKFRHRHGVEGFSMIPIRFYDDVEDAPKTTSECFKIMYDDASQLFKESYAE